MLGNWRDAPAVVLSCPGPLRRYAAALQPIEAVALPQMLLGSESQLLAVATDASCRPSAARLFFTPFPEMFPHAASLASALRRVGVDAPGDVVHLRFGGVRSARVLKGARNAAMLAECRGAPLLTASHHPFAGGLVLPAAMQRVYRLTADAVQPERIGGIVLPVHDLPQHLISAAFSPVDFGPDFGLGFGPGLGPGLEATGLDSFRSEDWASGQVLGESACPADGTPAVLVPWNMDHPGSIVPELLTRFARLGRPGDTLPRMILLPFNYIGQTGIIREVIARVRAASGLHGTLLSRLFLARVTGLAGVPALRALSRTAWVDGNDPESWWTLGRLAACGIATVLIGAGQRQSAPARHVAADEALRVEAETRCGMLIFQARVPALRALPDLLRITAEQQALTPPDAIAATKTAPTKTAPTKTAPTKTAPTKTAPTKTAPTKTAPTKTAPTKTAPTKTAATTAPTKTAPAKTAATTAPTKPGPTKPARRRAKAAT